MCPSQMQNDALVYREGLGVTPAPPAIWDIGQDSPDKKWFINFGVKYGCDNW